MFFLRFQGRDNPSSRGAQSPVSAGFVVCIGHGGPLGAGEHEDMVKRVKEFQRTPGGRQTWETWCPGGHGRRVGMEDIGRREAPARPQHTPPPPHATAYLLGGSSWTPGLL